MIEVVNVVASESLGLEFDFEAVVEELDAFADYNPDKYPGMYLRFGEDAPLITVYRTGKYIVTGGRFRGGGTGHTRTLSQPPCRQRDDYSAR